MKMQRKLNSFIIFLSSIFNQIKEGGVDRMCIIHGVNEECTYRFYLENLKERGHLGDLCTWNNRIKTNLKQVCVMDSTYFR